MAAKIRKRRSQSAAPAVALSIAGSDSSAGAGIQADLKTFAARGVYGLTAVTCIVAEIPGKVSRIQPADPSIVCKQIAVLFNAFPIRATKTGLLCNAQIISAVVHSLRDRRREIGSLKLVVDPVMIATSGDVLLEPEAIAVYERELFPFATLLTPNLDEAMQLLGEEIRDLPAMRRAVKALAARYKVAVLLKGGHLRSRRALDLLYNAGRTIEVAAPYVTGVRTHGTGCTYSAAITAELAKGADLDRAVRTGKHVVSSAIRRHIAWKTGRAKIVALNLMAGIRPD
jgi:hydroxymethylpyrimidine/phosphomethylpyrimidine kinase